MSSAKRALAKVAAGIPKRARAKEPRQRPVVDLGVAPTAERIAKGDVEDVGNVKCARRYLACPVSPMVKARWLDPVQAETLRRYVALVERCGYGATKCALDRSVGSDPPDPDILMRRRDGLAKVRAEVSADWQTQGALVLADGLLFAGEGTLRENARRLVGGGRDAAAAYAAAAMRAVAGALHKPMGMA